MQTLSQTRIRNQLETLRDDRSLCEREARRTQSQADREGWVDLGVKVRSEIERLESVIMRGVW